MYFNYSLMTGGSEITGLRPLCLKESDTNSNLNELSVRKALLLVCGGCFFVCYVP